MNINIELLKNDEKNTFSVLNKNTGEHTSLQESAFNRLERIFDLKVKYFNSRKDLSIYVKNIKKELKNA